MTLHDSHLSRLFEPALRGYVIAAAAALFVIFAVQLDAGSMAAAGVPVLCGIAGLLLRWTAMPVALVTTLGYFLFFPIGLPFGFSTQSLIWDSYFHLDDLVLAAAVLVYLAAQYRIFDLTQPTQNSAANAELSRPASTIDDGEWIRSAAMIAAFAIVGQAIWWLLTNLEIHIGADSLLRWMPPYGTRFRPTPSRTATSAELNRFLLLVLGVGMVAVLARLIFWYLRLANLAPAEARLILLDAAWREHRRELARIETWRSARLGHDRSRRGNASRTFRWTVRTIVLAILGSFLAWILYFTIQYG